ncbi:MAG: amidohydrolase family protein [Roseburia sp.]|nr:amidohydrolase family protein [Roseburia sp.]
MRYYNTCIYDRRDNLVHGTIIDVDEETGIIREVYTDNNYKPEDGDFDCHGLVAYPAFMDCAVVAPGKYLFSSCGLDISGYNSVREYRNAIETYAKEKPIRGFGYNSFIISEEGTGVLKKLLDKRYPNKPAYILADDMTTVVVNEAVLEVAKEYFSVSRELHSDGELDYYQLSILRAKTDIFDFTVEELQTALLAFQYEMLSNGITAVKIVDTLGGWSVIEAIKQLYESGVWLLTAVLNVPVYPFESVDEMWQKYQKYLDITNQRMFVTGISLCLDGSIDSTQAALQEPYEGSAEWTGDIMWSLSKLSKVVSTFVDAGIDVNARAYGDRAVSAAVFAMSGRNTDYKSGRRIITHAYLMSDDDISLCNREGIIVCVEPNSVPCNNIFYEGDEIMLGERCFSQYPVGRLVFSGVKIIAGSNVPTQADINPIHGVYKATHRVSADDVTIYQSLIAYGKNAYSSVGLWNKMGSISVGKLANFVLLNKDLIHMNETALMDVLVMGTVVCGKTVYSS